MSMGAVNVQKRQRVEEPGEGEIADLRLCPVSVQFNREQSV